MADAYSQTISGEVATTLGANARKTQHDTFNYGTPGISPLVVQRLDEGDFSNSGNANSDFHKVMAVIQTRAEIYGIGRIGGNFFTLLVRDDTLAADDGDDRAPNITEDLDYLEDEVFNATGIDCNIENGKIVSDGIDYDC